MNKFMKSALGEAVSGMENGHGGPFGAVIVNSENGAVISSEHNRVLETNDPTMHAEIAAIRKACDALGRFSLHDCVIYSTCMPCPMCLGAIMWAKISKLYYGATAADAANAGFDDDYMYDFIKNNLEDDSKLIIERIDGNECAKPFIKWNEMENKNSY